VFILSFDKTTFAFIISRRKWWKIL